jgi:ABC-2 type transport system permease protein
MNIKFDRLHALVVKEFIQMFRDKITLALLVFMPVAQLLIFGFAINTDVKHVSTCVLDHSRSQESREMINSFTASKYFDLVQYAESIHEVNKSVESGKAKVGLIFPTD